MIRRPPRSTRTDTLFPYTTLVRSVGVSAAISDSERTTATGTLLADVKPTFSWVRLAQRVPVRIAIDRVPKGLMLVAGRTATVTLDGADEQLDPKHILRSEEHTSELQSLMRISYAVFCLKKKNTSPLIY